ncbi:MAG: hypothetical protein ACE14V_16790 [bacterium]
MKYKIIVFLSIILAVAGISQVKNFKQYTNQSIFPLKKGSYWIYRGPTKWVKISDPENKVVQKTITWKMEVLDSVTKDDITIATIKGFPTDLAWYEESKPRGDYLLITVNTTQYYLIQGKNKEDILASINNNNRLDEDILNQEDEILDLPLTIGKRFAGDTTRQDNWYCWYIEDAQKVDLTYIKGVKLLGKINQYRLVYRTMPDHQIIEFVPKVGIIRYIYVHHGTASETDLKLIEFHLGTD